MNCRLCQKESDLYRGGKLSADMKKHVEDHLMMCAECAESYRIQSLADRIINQEKEICPDNYLTSRIMAHIENSEAIDQNTTLPFIRILKPVLIMTSMAAAIFIGVLIGNIYKPAVSGVSKPVELALIDDAAIESIDILSNE